jgi:hypothetical protein
MLHPKFTHISLFYIAFYLFYFPVNTEGSAQEPQKASQEIRTSDEE